jgi:hypothetical protein
LHALQDFRAECRAESVDYTIVAGGSLIHWLVIPWLGDIMRKQTAVRFATSNLRTNEIVQQLNDGRVDSGVIRKDAVIAPLRSASLGPLTFVAIAPKSLVPARFNLSLRDLIETLPFAAQTSDGQFTQKLRDIAKELQTKLRPALICQSFPQAMAAVRSGDLGPCCRHWHSRNCRRNHTSRCPRPSSTSSVAAACWLGIRGCRESDRVQKV